MFRLKQINVSWKRIYYETYALINVEISKTHMTLIEMKT